MPTESKHTPEPWRASNTDDKCVYINNPTGGRLVADCYGHSLISHEEEQANAARIIACVNACEGMADPAADIAALRAPRGPVFLAVYIGTTNDVNGNPRRGWYVSRIDGAPVIPEVPPNGRNSGKGAAYTCWVEEGYSGDGALLAAVATAAGHVTDYKGDKWAQRDRARALVHETGRINVTPGEYRHARKLPRFGGAS